MENTAFINIKEKQPSVLLIGEKWHIIGIALIIIEVKCQWIIFPVLCIFLWLIDCLCPCLINFKVFYTLTKLMVALCITQFPPIHNFFKVLFFAFFAIQNLELVLNKAYHFLYSFLILLIIFPVLLCFLSHI